MGVGKTVGGVLGGVGGFMVGGPGGAMLGYAGGSALGGALDDRDETYDASPARGRVSSQYGSQTNNVAYGEAERASQMGAANAESARLAGRDMAVGANHGIATADIARDAAARRSSGLYGDAAGMYGRAEGNAADAAAARGDSMAAIGRLRSFYEQGPGPSAAEAQLRMGNDANARNAMSIARTGGGSPSAMRAAMRAGAAGGAQTNQAAGVLRAQEAANWQNTRLNAMNAEQGALAGVRQGDVGVMGQRFGAAQSQLGAAGQAGNTALGYGTLGAQYQGLYQQGRLGSEGMAQGATQAGEQMRGNIFDRQLQSDTARYGADKGVQVGMANVAQRDRAADMAMTGSLIGAGVNMLGQQQQPTSDVRAKENIRPASAANLISRLDAVQSMAGQPAATEKGPAVDLRTAKGYSYDYVSPSYGPDNQVGPMAQDLEHTAAAGAVTTGPDGMKKVDPNRLTMTNTAAIGEQQRRLDALEAMVADNQKLKTGAPTSPRIRGERY